MQRQCLLGQRVRQTTVLNFQAHRRLNGRDRDCPLTSLRHATTTSSSSRGLPRPSRKVPIIAALVIMGTSITALMYATSKAQRTTSFVEFELVAKQPVSSTASIFHLAPKHDPDVLQRYATAWERGIWNVRFKQPQLQIVRAYTPLPPAVDGTTKGANTCLRFLIRQDMNGEVSSYLHRLPIGASIEVSGPKLEYVIPKDTRKVVFLAGGTGIAPAMQIAHALYERGLDGRPPTLHVLWASRRREDCTGGVSDCISGAESRTTSWWPRSVSEQAASLLSSKTLEHDMSTNLVSQGMIVKELEALKNKYPGYVTVDYFVDEESSFIQEKNLATALSHFDAGGHRKRQQVIVSGPPGFVAYLAGPKVWRDGFEEQGPLGGVLGRLLQKTNVEAKTWKV